MPVVMEQFNGVFDADVNHSSLEAGVRHMGVGSFRTRFEDVTAHLIATEDTLRVEGRVRVDSIAIRNPQEFREHVLYGEDFFDAHSYPEIQFSSENIALSEDGSVTMLGELTIKNVTRELTATGTYRAPLEDPYGSLCSALDLHASIDRRDFRLTWQAALPNGANALEWDVALAVHLELVRR